MPLPKPSSRSLWTETNPGARVEPTGSVKEAGWAPDQRPPAEIMNWIHYIEDQWVEYFESITDEHAALMAGVASIYDAVIGTGGNATHAPTVAGFNAALAAVNPGAMILVRESFLMDGQIQVVKNDIELKFKPGVVVSRDAGLGANPGFRITANGFKCYGGRFSLFNTGSSYAFQIDAASQYAMLRDIRFANSPEDVDDQNGGATILGCINE